MPPVRLACAAFLVALGVSRVYYASRARAHPADRTPPPTPWVIHWPAYVMSTVWTSWVAAGVVVPEWIARWDAWLDWPLRHPLWSWAGIALMALGLWLFWWSHRTIGRYWSLRIQLKAKHELIRHGPYRFVRHPLYTSFFLAYLGTVLAMQSPSLLVGFPGFVGSYLIFAQAEERVLARAFGEAYQQYQREAGMFWPKFP